MGIRRSWVFLDSLVVVSIPWKNSVSSEQNQTVDRERDVFLGLLVPSRYFASICSKLMPLVSGIAKKAVMSVRLQKPEYMRKAPLRPNDAMIVGTSLTAMKRETLSMIPSKAEPKLRMSAGNSSPVYMRMT